MMSNFQTRFISFYTLALEYKLNTHQLAQVLDIKVNTVQRYVNLIQSTMGVSLLPLPKEPAEFIPNLHEELETRKPAFIDAYTQQPKTYIITCAQNATPINAQFLKCLQLYSEKIDGEIVVIKTRYKNPTSAWTSSQEGEEWWDKRISQYAIDSDIKISPSMIILGSIKVQPTASQPLSGFDSYTGLSSGIIGHPKIQLKTIPTPSNYLPKILTTTGAITEINYTDSKSGKKGEFHHSLGACIVEVDSAGKTFIRHIHANHDGSFYDLDMHVSIKGITSNNRVAGLITGDAHFEFYDPNVEKATFSNPDSMCNVLKPEVIVYHDVDDFYRRNHHHKGDHLLAFAKHHLGRNNVEEGMQIVADFIDSHTMVGCTNVIVKSNHDEALNRWLKEADPKADPENARLYYYLMYHLMKEVKLTPTGYSYPDPFEFWCKFPDTLRGMSNKSTIFLKRDESFTIKGIEVGFHGDKGPNGARGSIRSFTKIGPKTIIGHSHTPGIEEGVYQVGVSARLDLEYVSGPSSWMQTHCIIYQDGKRTLLHILDGEWKMKKGD